MDHVKARTGSTLPRIGEPAPPFSTQTASGQSIVFPKDFAGRWAVSRFLDRVSGWLRDCGCRRLVVGECFEWGAVAECGM